MWSWRRRTKTHEVGAGTGGGLYAFDAVKRLPLAALVGLLGGAVGVGFHHGIRQAVLLREAMTG